MSTSSWNFKDDLTVDNNKFIKFFDSTGITKNNILGINTASNLYIHSAINGDIYVNSGTNTRSNTFFHTNSIGNTFITTRLAIGINNTSNINSNIVLPINSYIGLNTTQGNHTGYIALAASSSLLNTTGSRILLYGINNTSSSGQINMYAGNNTAGHIQLYTQNDSMKVQILNSGTTNFQPNGSTIRLSVSDTTTTITNPVNITATTPSTNATTGALTVSGGVGIVGDTYVNGTLNINSITGNLNFSGSQVSTSYSSGATSFIGGVGITCSVGASSETAGGGLSVAGGLALGRNAILGGNIAVYNTDASTSALTGSGIFYGGMGVNGQVNIRSNSNSQIKLTPVTNGNETSIYFGRQNNYTTSGSWILGQNALNVSSGNFAIGSADDGTYIRLISNIIFMDKTLSLSNETVTNLVVTNISSNTLALTNINLSGGTITNLFSTNQTVTNIVVTNISSNTLALTNINVSGGTITNLLTTNQTVTNICSSSGNLLLGVMNGLGVAGSIRIGRNDGFTTIRYHDLECATSTTQTSSYMAIKLHNASTTTSQTEVMRLRADGNVGIGTTSPAYTLDVNGSGDFTTFVTAGSLFSINQTTTNIVATTSTIPNIIHTNISSSTLTLSSHIRTDTTKSLDGPVDGWWYIGRFDGSTSGETCIIEFNSGGGYNGLTDQNASTLIHLRNGNGVGQNIAATISRFGVSNLFNAIQLSSESTGNVSTAGDWDVYVLPANRYQGRPVVKIHTGNNAAFIPSYTTVGSVTATNGTTVISVTDSYVIRTPSAFVNTLAIGTTGNSSLFTLDVTGTGRISTSLTTGALFSTNQTTTNIVATNLSAGTLALSNINVSGGTITNLLTTSQTVTNLIITNQSATNIVATNITNTNLYVSNVMSITNSVDSSNSTTGALLIAGGISIAKTTNSTSTTNGGALTIAGGLSILKDVYVGGTVTSSSDKRIKKNIRPLESILDKIDDIYPIKYNSMSVYDSKDYIGFIAQDFEQYFPELLNRSNKEAYYSLAYDRITALNFKCIKELKTQNDKLIKRINALEQLLK